MAGQRRNNGQNSEQLLTTGDEMRDPIIGALDTGCRRGEMLKFQNKQVDWRHRWIRILKEHSKTEAARVIQFEAGSRLEEAVAPASFPRTRRIRCSARLRPERTWPA